MSWSVLELGLVPARNDTDSDWLLGHFKIAQNKGVDLLSLSVIVVMMEISSDLIVSQTKVFLDIQDGRERAPRMGEIRFCIKKYCFAERGGCSVVKSRVECTIGWCIAW